MNPDARYPGREREVGWRTYPQIARWGYVSLGAVMRPTRSVCGYAETFVELDEARPITLWVGAGGATRVWFNGEPVIEDGAIIARTSIDPWRSSLDGAARTVCS